MMVFTEGLLMVSSLMSVISLLGGTSYNVSRYITKLLYERNLIETLDVANTYMIFNHIGSGAFGIGTILSATARTAPLAIITLPFVALKVFVLSMDVVNKDMNEKYALDNKRVALDILAHIATNVHVIGLTAY